MRPISYLLLVGGLSACAGAKTTEKGPKVEASLDCGSTRVSEATLPDVLKECEIDTEKKAYVFTLTISTHAGSKDTENSHEQPEIFTPKEPSVKIEVDGQSITTPTFTTRDGYQGVNYDYPEFTVPDTSAGKNITVHVEGTDERGLKSNSVDLKMVLKTPKTP